MIRIQYNIEVYENHVAKLFKTSHSKIGVRFNICVKLTTLLLPLNVKLTVNVTYFLKR